MPTTKAAGTGAAQADPTPTPSAASTFTTNPTQGTWLQQANEQAAAMMTSGNMNSKTPITEFDPIYGKLIWQIGDTMYRRIRYAQRYANLGRTAPENGYPGILREIVMAPRKGWDYPFDREETPTTLGCYDIHRDTIEVRYHGAQYRWMYEWTVFDEILRRFARENGRPMLIGELAEMQLLTAMNARNLFMDLLRKQTMYVMAQNSQSVASGIDITSDTLTQQQAQDWLLFIKGLLYELEDGTSAYNGLGYYMQTPRSDLQIVMTARAYDKVVSKAFPDTFHPEFFENILPENMIRINTFGATVMDSSGTTPVTVTYDDRGMSLLKYNPAITKMQESDPTIQAVIMHRDCMGFEDNLNGVYPGPKDIVKLATPMAMHYWTKAYFTDMLPCVVVRSEVK